MSEKEHLDKEELLSGYIDGQLTPRQLTELKRLLAHDPNLHKELAAMEQQRQTAAITARGNRPRADGRRNPFRSGTPIYSRRFRPSRRPV